MDVAWGMSNSEFTVLLLFLMVLLRGGISLLNLLARIGPKTGYFEPDQYQLAYLSGGVDRVADSVVAELVAAGALRVGPDGKLRATGIRAQHEYQQRVLDWAGDGIAMAELRRAFRRSGITRALVAWLSVHGLISGSGRLQALRVLIGLLGAVAAAGLIRIVDSLIRGYFSPECLLVSLVVFLWVGTLHLGWEPKRTFKGDRVVDRARAASEVPAGNRHARQAFSHPVQVATAVAIHGMEQYPDERVVAHLNIPLAWWKRALLGGRSGGGDGGDGDGGDGGGE
ncbi:TIGR04222 domain-containing membrane protein [Saccharopolyspora sp. NPDC050642]|uniref:TIGR04222 domain-containing membrane protein n=1 Tax=Saccharopolyspora sp. NPDC050642 TaxID=3157099 RepID=UPI0033F6FFBE